MNPQKIDFEPCGALLSLSVAHNPRAVAKAAMAPLFSPLPDPPHKGEGNEDEPAGATEPQRSGGMLKEKGGYTKIFPIGKILVFNLCGLTRINRNKNPLTQITLE